MRSRAWFLAGVASIAAIGCMPAPDVEPLACQNEVAGVASLGVGDLDVGFAPMEDGDAVQAQLGPQGMHMLMVSVRVDRLEAASVGSIGTEISIRIEQAGAVIGGTVADMQPSAESGDITDFLGMRAIFTVDDLEELTGEPIEVEAQVRDGCGRALVSIREWELYL
jgi:hypothetical protein